MYSTDNLNPKDWIKGQEAASGPVAITVEKHKIDFRKQYGTFSDKPSENVTRWLEKAETYQKAHMIPSLEMASIVMHCLLGEPFIKVQRMLDVPGEDYVNSDHFTEQEEQKAVKYTPYKPRVNAQPEEKDPLTNVVTKEEVKQKDAEPAIAPVRYQPKVTPTNCLKAYLLELYGKTVNLTDADKFLSTFKTQKPRQTCSNYLDEFVINYENYAHMKWKLTELNGVKAKDATLTEAKVDAVPSNIKIRNEEKLRLVSDGLCSEFKTHCDNTQFDLTKKSYIEIEKQVMHWQKSTITGKKFTASCILAKPTSSATVAALEFEQSMDKPENNENTGEPVTSSTQVSQQSTRGQGRGRGQRGGRGRGGRGRGAATGRAQRPIISRDTEDGNHPNYKQTQDGQLQRSIHGYPLCNYCGGASHKRQYCPVKLHDRAAGNNRINHPDRDKPSSVQDKIKKQEQTRSSAAMMTPMEQQMSKLWQQNPWPQHPPPATAYQTPMNSQDNILFQQQQHHLGPIGASAATMHPNQQVKPTPCPYPTCHAVLADFNQTQFHMNQFHAIPTLARGPGAEP